MGRNVPEGYLQCDGAIYNIAEYEILANYINEQFGSYNYWGGDGETTFAVPDLRGEFLRGTGTATRNTGTGAEVGEHQDGTNIPYAGGDLNNNLIYGRNQAPSNADILRRGNILTWISKTLDTSDNVITTFTVRPTNTSVLYCIKY